MVQIEIYCNFLTAVHAETITPTFCSANVPVAGLALRNIGFISKTGEVRDHNVAIVIVYITVRNITTMIKTITFKRPVSYEFVLQCFKLF